MSIITLTSDWSASDYYVGVIKGRILGSGNKIEIVDISHKIQAFNSIQAAFVLRNAYPAFPPGTVHLIFVNSESSNDKPFLAVKSAGQYFIGADNGIFSLICGDEIESIVKIRMKPDNSFSSLIIFPEIAVKLAEGMNIEELGEASENIIKRIPLRPTIDHNTLTGSVIYIDSYQNAITNISRDLFEKVTQNREYEIYVQSKHYRINHVSNYYNEVQVGELLALFNSVGLLEIAINNGNAARLLNLDTNSTVRVELKEKKK
jgi:S-adenosylmethionine hydrolase